VNFDSGGKSLACFAGSFGTTGGLGCADATRTKATKTITQVGRNTLPSTVTETRRKLDACGILVIAVAVDLPGPVVLYDGVCGLCNRSVKFLIERDGGQLYYAPLQGETARALRTEYPAIPQTLESVVLVDDGKVYLRSKAFLYGAKYLTRPWRWAHYVRWLPAFVLDLGYRLIARIRYRVWGKYDACELPSRDERAHLLP
jgi:predicted DCC family thiol-disulfide oxidoreductase YuxK